jgi:3-isopropylmalate/(R)-2-methylmalate dehydratase small subunit
VKKFTVHDGLVVPLDRANVDTDAILPKQFLKSVKRTGFGVNLFDDWRYLDPYTTHQATRRVDPDFILNRPAYADATILLARENFGCGSSREHAPWALADYGFRVIIAPSFADIFFSNCCMNGLLPIQLTTQEIDALFQKTASTPGFRLVVKLDAQCVDLPDGQSMSFTFDAFRKEALLNGLDDIGLTLQNSDDITAFEARRRLARPWVNPITSDRSQ